MPPRQPKVYHIQLRTHKLCVMLTAQPSDTIMSLKHAALDALTSDVMHPEDIDMDMDFLEGLDSVRDFELVRSKGRSSSSTGEYETLDPGKQIRESGLSGWEKLFLQFRSKETGLLLPVTYTLPSIDDEDEDPTAPSGTTAPIINSTTSSEDTPMSAVSKGKRKASEIDVFDV